MWWQNPLDRLHRLVKSYVIIFVLWGIYRLIFRLPETVEEIFLKPLVFVGGVMLVERPKSWQKFFGEIWGKGDPVRAAFWGLSLGLGYITFNAIAGLLSGNALALTENPGGEQWGLFWGLGLATAIWEEWTFSGYILGGLSKITTSKWTARIVTAVLFGLVHLPILIFWNRLGGIGLGFQFVSLLTLGIGNAILMGYCKNLLAPVISHTLWGAAVFLFR